MQLTQTYCTTNIIHTYMTSAQLGLLGPSFLIALQNGHPVLV